MIDALLNKSDNLFFCDDWGHVATAATTRPLRLNHGWPSSRLGCRFLALVAAATVVVVCVVRRVNSIRQTLHPCRALSERKHKHRARFDQKGVGLDLFAAVAVLLVFVHWEKKWPHSRLPCGADPDGGRFVWLGNQIWNQRKTFITCLKCRCSVLYTQMASKSSGHFTRRSYSLTILVNYVRKW